VSRLLKALSKVCTLRTGLQEKAITVIKRRKESIFIVMICVEEVLRYTF